MMYQGLYAHPFGFPRPLNTRLPRFEVDPFTSALATHNSLLDAKWQAYLTDRDGMDRQRIADGMSLAGALARFEKEGRSEDFIAGFVEGRRAGYIGSE